MPPLCLFDDDAPGATVDGLCLDRGTTGTEWLSEGLNIGAGGSQRDRNELAPHRVRKVLSRRNWTERTDHADRRPFWKAKADDERACGLRST